MGNTDTLLPLVVYFLCIIPDGAGTFGDPAEPQQGRDADRWAPRSSVSRVSSCSAHKMEQNPKKSEWLECVPRIVISTWKRSVSASWNLS